MIVIDVFNFRLHKYICVLQRKVIYRTTYCLTPLTISGGMYTEEYMKTLQAARDDVLGRVNGEEPSNDGDSGYDMFAMTPFANFMPNEKQGDQKKVKTVRRKAEKKKLVNEDGETEENIEPKKSKVPKKSRSTKNKSSQSQRKKKKKW